MIQTGLGRRRSLAICTMATALSTFAFIRVQANWAVIISSMIISAAATAMYAVLCKLYLFVTEIQLILADGMTPETFGTTIRGTACGTSAALSRLYVHFREQGAINDVMMHRTGIMAPVSAGLLLTLSPSLPVFVSAAIFVATAACSLALPFERVPEGKRGGGAMAH